MAALGWILCVPWLTLVWRPICEQEAKRFDNIDKQWQKIMTDTSKNTNVLDACSADGRLTTLQVQGTGGTIFFNCTRVLHTNLL
jgi:hypothetical protein